jgi:hypothetical protein
VFRQTIVTLSVFTYLLFLVSEKGVRKFEGFAVNLIFCMCRSLFFSILNGKRVGMREIALAEAQTIYSIEDIGLSNPVFPQQTIHSGAKAGLEGVVVLELEQLKFME